VTLTTSLVFLNNGEDTCYILQNTPIAARKWTMAIRWTRGWTNLRKRIGWYFVRKSQSLSTGHSCWHTWLRSHAPTRRRRK